MDLTSQIKTKLEEKGLSPNSIKLYVRNVEILNNKQPLKSITFLNKVDDIMEKINKHKPNSQKTYLVSVVSVLNVLKENNKKLEKIYKTYYDKMMNISKTLRDTPTEEKTETQKENWLKWEDILKVENELQEKVNENPDDYDSLLNLLVLSLYTK